MVLSNYLNIWYFQIMLYFQQDVKAYNSIYKIIYHFYVTTYHRKTDAKEHPLCYKYIVYSHNVFP